MLQWLGDDEYYNTLWIYGPPGAGKTTLIDHAVDRIRDRPQRPGREILCTYWFFETFKDNANCDAAFFKGIVSNLLQQNPAVRRVITSVLASHDMFPAAPQSSTSQDSLAPSEDLVSPTLKQPINDPNLTLPHDMSVLEEILRQLASTHRIYLLVDALNECMNNGPAVQHFVQRLSRVKNLRWCIASRTRPPRGNEHEIRLGAIAEKDSYSSFSSEKQVVDFQSQLNWTDERTTAFSRKIKEKSDREAWYGLIMSDVILFDPDLVAGSELSPSELPEDLSSLFACIITKRLQRKSEGPLWARIISVMLATQQHLTVESLAYYCDLFECEPWASKFAFHDILTKSGLVVFDNDGGADFSHPKVVEFLKSPPGLALLGQWNVHSHIATLAIREMARSLKQNMCNLSDFKCSRWAVNSLEAGDRLVYACCHWVHHLECGLHYFSLGHRRSAVDLIGLFLRQLLPLWLEVMYWLCAEDQVSVVLETIEKTTRDLDGPLYREARQAKALIDSLRARAVHLRPLQVYVFIWHSNIIFEWMHLPRPPWITIKKILIEACPQLVRLSPQGSWAFVELVTRNVLVIDTLSGEIKLSMPKFGNPTMDIRITSDESVIIMSCRRAARTAEIYRSVEGSCRVVPFTKYHNSNQQPQTAKRIVLDSRCGPSGTEEACKDETDTCIVSSRPGSRLVTIVQTAAVTGDATKLLPRKRVPQKIRRAIKKACTSLLDADQRVFDLSCIALFGHPSESLSKRVSLVGTCASTTLKTQRGAEGRSVS